MRQLSKSDGGSRLTQKLDQAGVSQTNIDWLVPYLDMSQPEQPALLERAVRQEPKPGDPAAGYFLYLLVDLLKGRDQEYNDRVVKAFFRVIGPYCLSAAVTQVEYHLRFWDRVSRDDLSLEELLGAGGRAAMEAGRWLSNGSGREALMKLTAGELEAALDCLPQSADPVRLVLWCLWLASQRPKGLLTNLLGGKKDKTAEAVREIQEGVVALLPRVGLDSHDAAVPRLADYIRQGKDGPLPARIKCPTVQYWNAFSDVGAVGGACFLALEAAPSLRPAFLVCAGIASAAALLRGLDLAGEERFRAELEWLVKYTNVSSVLVSLSHGRDDLTRYIAERFPQLYEDAIRKGDHNVAEDLLKTVRKIDPEWAARILQSNLGSARNKAIQELSSHADPADRTAVADYLRTGEGLAPLLVKYPIGGSKSWNGINFAENYVKDYGTDCFAVRFLIAASMLCVNYHVSYMWNDVLAGLPAEPRTAGGILDMALQEGLSPMDCLRLVEATDRGAFSTEQKAQRQESAQWLLAQPKEVRTQALRQGSACIRGIVVQALANKGDMEALIPLAGDNSKQVRQLIAEIFAARPGDEGIKAVAKLLESKKPAQRGAALDILDQLGENAFQVLRPQLEEALEREKNAKLAGRLRQLLGVKGEEASEGQIVSGDLVKEALKGGKKRKIQWVLDGTKQLVSRVGEGALSDEDRLAAVMVCCTDSGSLEQAKTLAQPLDRGELAAFAQTVYELWLEQRAPSKQKWVLVFASVFGGHSMVDTLKRQITQWPQEARGAIACDAVNALALSPEPEALLLVDSISRKFTFKQVKAAAGRALEFAAKELGLTAEELADRIVPDLGLDARGSRVFDYGPRSFTVTLTPALELEVKTQEGKKLKTLPAPGKQDDPALAGEASAQFKALKKQIKAAVSTQTLRLEQALSTGRSWTGQGWQELFVQKPVMRQFAVGLIWGVYQEDALTATFRYLEDGSLNTADEEEYELPDQARVGLVHPVELTEEALEAWKEQLEDYEIKQPFPQLTRPVFHLEAGMEKDAELDTFGGKVINGLSLSGRMLAQGWFRGSVEDGGMYYSFYREDGPTGVQLNFSGAYVGGEDSEVVLYEVQFYHAGTVRRGSYVYDAPKDDRLIPLGQVAPRLFSEVVYQLQKATASSTEVQEDWKQSKRW